MLQNKILSLILVLFSTATFAYTDFSKVEFRFLNATESSAFLSTADDFTKHLTAIDLSLHHSTSATISQNDHLEFLKHTSLDWTPAEMALVNGQIEIMKQAVNSLDLSLNLPSEIKLIKTTGADEFNAYYTRGNAIIFPIANREEGVKSDAPTIFHETFHIMSRYNPELSDALYALCNFKPIPEVIIPKSLQDITLTNPDAFVYQHAITVTVNGNEINVIPFFYSALKQAEVKVPVDEATTFKLGMLDLATINDEHPTMYKTADTNYKDRTYSNSHYYIHPEEIMAENFRLLLTKAAKIEPMPPVKYPEVLEKLSELLK